MEDATLDKARALQDRTKKFALRVVLMFKALPQTTEAQVMGKQVLRSGTSVAANYRAACRSRSRAEFVSRMAIVIEEADETVLWLELLVESDTVPEEKMKDLISEANELVSIFSASRQTARKGSG